MKEKNWKVIKIIDDYKIVINGGKNDFLNIDDELEIFIEGESLIDPDTKEVLGNLDFIKARIRVKDLFDKFSICVNSEEITTSLAQVMSAGLMRTSQKPLKVDSSQITGYNLDSDKIIRTGDLVRKSL